jgi:hypothetical protein
MKHNMSNSQQRVSSIYSSVVNSQYVVMPQNLLVNETIGHTNSSYPASYSQTSYTNNLYNIRQGPLVCPFSPD